MTRFSVGERVVIRYGRRQGQKATVMKCQPADVYQVKAADGVILFFSGKGLVREVEHIRQPDWDARRHAFDPGGHGGELGAV